MLVFYKDLNPIQSREPLAASSSCVGCLCLLSAWGRVRPHRVLMQVNFGTWKGLGTKKPVVCVLAWDLTLWRRKAGSRLSMLPTEQKQAALRGQIP